MIPRLFIFYFSSFNKFEQVSVLAPAPLLRTLLVQYLLLAHILLPLDLHLFIPINLLLLANLILHVSFVRNVTSVIPTSTLH